MGYDYPDLVLVFRRPVVQVWASPKVMGDGVGLFSVNGENVAALVPSVFAERHVEKDIQVWADRCPAMLNDGRPMLSLGMEIVTTYGQYLDNLYLDGNGTLVVAEMKRGKSPRDVIAQVMQYGSYVSRLDWLAIEQFCQKRHGKPLDDAYAAVFGRALPRSPKPAHRLLVVAESFDPQVFDDALYGLNHGIPLALLQFRFYRVGEAEMVDTATVLGEIPDQAPPSRVTAPASTPTATPPQAATEASIADTGYSAWLLNSLADKLTEAAERRGWHLRAKVNQTSLPFGDEAWPLNLGDCQLRVDTYKGGVVSLRLHFRTEAAPGLAVFLDGHRAEWADRFPGVLPKSSYPTPNTVYTLELPRPPMGDQAGMAEMFAKVEAMAEALLPLVSAYFAQSTVPA